MIKIKGFINVEKKEMQKVRAGDCSYKNGDLQIKCDEYHAHVGLAAIDADHLHVHYE